MKRILLATLFLLMTSTQVLSQSQAPTATPVAYQVSVVQIKSGMRQEYLDFRKAETLPALKKAGVKEAGVWATTMFGQSGEYIFATPMESLAQFDEPGPIRRALGEEGARAHNTRQARFIETARTYAISLRPELSLTPKAGTALMLAIHTTIRIAPGRRAEYENIIKNDVLPILKKAEVKGYLLYRVVLGGDANEYHSLLLVDSFAEAQKTSQALNQEGFGKLEPKAAGIVTHTETAMIRYVPEQSIRPDAQKAAK